MSLTQEISKTIQATNELNQTVKDKIGNIDNEMAKFQNSFEPNLRKSLKKAFYFDGDLGSDSNDGSEKYPFKTLHAMKGHLVNGVRYAFYISGTVELSDHLELSNNIVIIAKNEKASSAKIVQNIMGETVWDSNKYATAASLYLRDSYLHFHHVDIETATSPTLPVFFTSSFIARDDYGLGYVSIFGNPSINRTVNVTINDGTFCRLATGPDLKNFTFWGINFTKNGDGYLLDVQNSVSMIKINNSTYPEGQTVRDYIFGIKYKNGTPVNILTSNDTLLNLETA